MTEPGSVYDQIGVGYARTRRSDPRWQRVIEDVIGAAASVINVGAGTGNYEPAHRRVIAVEPSPVMIAQRPPTAAPVVRAVAEHLPFGDAAVDVAMAVLTVHHWSDWRRGVAELRRVARRVVMLTFDPVAVRRFWLVRDYLPEIADLDEARLPALADLRDALGRAEIRTLTVPADCQDGFLAAWWRRPAAYLHPDVGGGCSGFAQLDPQVLRRGLAALESDLASGAWEQRNGALRQLDELDAGYRLVIT